MQGVTASLVGDSGFDPRKGAERMVKKKNKKTLDFLNLIEYIAPRKPF